MMWESTLRATHSVCWWVATAALGSVAALASGHAGWREGGRRSAIRMRRGVGPDESRTLALSLSRGNGRAGVRGGNFVVRAHRGHRACPRRARAPTDNSGASAGTPDCSPGAGGSPVGTGSPGGAASSGSQCTAGSPGGAAGSGSSCSAGSGSDRAASGSDRAASGSRCSAGGAEFGGRSAGHRKRTRDATRRRCAAEPAGAERAENPRQPAHRRRR